MTPERIPLAEVERQINEPMEAGNVRYSESFKAEETKELQIDAGHYMASVSGRLLVCGCNVGLFEANCQTPFESLGDTIIVENAGPAGAVLEWWAVATPIDTTTVDDV